MATPTTAVRPRLDREHLQPEAVRLRLAGASYRAIGSHLGVSHTTAVELLQAALDGPATSDTARLRTVEAQRLDDRLAVLTRRRAALAAMGG